MRRTSAALVCAALVCCVPFAHASCSVAGVRLRFPSYEANVPGGMPTHGTIVVSCTDSPAPMVTLQLGPSAGSGGFFPRVLTQVGGNDRMAYNLYVDPATTVVWGDGSAGTATRSQRVPAGKPWVATVYARALPNQDPAPGEYTDAVTVTISF